jgi:hypothetical protein
MISTKFIQLTTSEEGDEFVAFDDLPAHVVNIFNGTGTGLTFKNSADTDDGEFELPSGIAYAFRGITNANQLLVKRTDESDTPVTLKSVEVEL